MPRLPRELHVVTTWRSPEHCHGQQWQQWKNMCCRWSRRAIRGDKEICKKWWQGLLPASDTANAELNPSTQNSLQIRYVLCSKEMGANTNLICPDQGLALPPSSVKFLLQTAEHEKHWNTMRNHERPAWLYLPTEGKVQTSPPSEGGCSASKFPSVPAPGQLKQLIARTRSGWKKPASVGKYCIM